MLELKKGDEYLQLRVNQTVYIGFGTLGTQFTPAVDEADEMISTDDQQINVDRNTTLVDENNNTYALVVGNRPKGRKK
jgi:hypothetical protein